MKIPGGLDATTLYEARCAGCGVRSGLCDTEAEAKRQALTQGYVHYDETWRCRFCVEAEAEAGRVRDAMLDLYRTGRKGPVR